MSEQKQAITHVAAEPALPAGAIRTDLARERRRKALGMLGSTVAFLLVVFFAGIFIFPLFWMIITSLKTLSEVFTVPPTWWPAKLMWSNYPTSLAMFPFWRYAWNTVRITIPVTVGVTLSSSLVAYSFARLRWPGRDIVFYLVLATLMIPNWVTLIPLYILYNNLGWINTYNPLIIPAFFGDAFSIFLLRQFFLRQPQDLGRRGACRRRKPSDGVYAHYCAPVPSGAGRGGALRVHQHLDRLLQSTDLPLQS